MNVNSEEVIGELYEPLFDGFTFILPNEVVKSEKGQKLINFFGHNVDEEFLDKYVDIFLRFNKNLDIEDVPPTIVPNKSNLSKIKELDTNTRYLVYLKDHVTKYTFKYIFETYLDKVILLKKGCDSLIENYHNFYLIHEDDPIYLFNEQRIIYSNHLSELEKIFIAKRKTNSSQEDYYNEIIKSFMELPSVKKNYEDFLKGKYSKNKEPKIIKPLRDFIVHDNKIEIENIVKKHLSHLRGVSLRYLIEYFVEQKILSLPNGMKTELYTSFKILFDGKDIADRNSIFGSKVFKGNADPDYIKMKKIFDNLFQKYFSL